MALPQPCSTLSAAEAPLQPGLWMPRLRALPSVRVAGSVGGHPWPDVAVLLRRVAPLARAQVVALTAASHGTYVLWAWGQRQAFDARREYYSVGALGLSSLAFALQVRARAAAALFFGACIVGVCICAGSMRRASGGAAADAPGQAWWSQAPRGANARRADCTRAGADAPPRALSDPCLRASHTCCGAGGERRAPAGRGREH